MKKKIRILIAKPGLDGHDRGAKIICQALRDGGFEVIYTGIRQTPEQIVNTVNQEDVDILGLSILSGAHLPLFKKITELLGEKRKEEIIIIAGGIIPEEDFAELEKLGVARVFGPGTNTGKIVDFIKDKISPPGKS